MRAGNVLAVAKASRAKGVAFEREVARVYEDAGWTVRGLEGKGDHLAFQAGGGRNWPQHVECKRQERIQLPMWLRQAKGEAPTGTIPVVVFRQNRTEPYACLPLRDLLRLV